MRNTVIAKWSLRPQRWTLGVVLIGLLLLSPQQCHGDDEPVTPTDSSQSQPAQQSPPGGPAPGSSATNHALPRDTAVARSAETRSNEPSGKCNHCFRDPDRVGDPNTPAAECLDDESKWNDEECEESPESVHCFTFKAYHRGPAKTDKNKKSKTERELKNFQVKTCHHRQKVPHNYETPALYNISYCAEHNLDLKLKDGKGKCVKGTYTLSSVESFHSCFSREHETFSLNDPTKFDSSEAKSQGYFGMMGGVQYAEIWLCLCKGEKCNTHKTKEIQAATQASATSLFKSFANESMITFTLIVTTASFLRLA